jgi:hypothetical protein
VSGQLHSFDGARLTALALAFGKTLRWAAWHPSGDWCLLVGNGGSVVRYEPDGGLQPIATGSRANLRGAAFAPDGERALLVGNQGAVFLLEGEALRTVETPTNENLRRAAWHPDGSSAVIVGNAGTVLRYDGGGLAPVPGDRAHTLRTVAWRPDGAYALVGAYASSYAGYPRPHALYRYDGRYLQALLTSDQQDDFVAIDWRPGARPGTHEALIAGYAFDDGVASSKLLTYDGAGFRYQPVGGDGVLLGAAWRQQGDYALLAGEHGLLLRYDGDRLDVIEGGTQDNLLGPFWRPNGASALLLRGPTERVYTV